MRFLRSPQFILALAGATTLTTWIWLAFLSKHVESLTLVNFVTVTAIAWAALAVAWWSAKKVSRRSLLIALWVGAVAFRLAGVIGRPVFEDDWARYLWDGRMLVQTGNPYQKPPELFYGEAALTDEWRKVLDTINNSDLPTIYAPVCQAAFALSYFVAPAQLWPLKLILIAAELVTLGWLLKLTTPRYALLFAWCPLLIKETAFTAHPDALWVAAMAAAFACFARGRWQTMAIACGIALAAKIFAVILVPFLLIGAPRKAWLVCGGVVAGLYAPFWMQGSAADWPALKEMAGWWEFNGTVVTWLAHGVGLPAAKIFGLLAFGAVWVTLFFRWLKTRTPPLALPAETAASQNPLPRADLLFGGFLLFSAVVNPWYLGALAAFAALRPSGWAIGAVMAGALAYAHGGNMNRPDLAPYELAAWVRPAELVVVISGYLLGRTGFLSKD